MILTIKGFHTLTLDGINGDGTDELGPYVNCTAGGADGLRGSATEQKPFDVPTTAAFFVRQANGTDGPRFTADTDVVRVHPDAGETLCWEWSAP